MRTSNQMATATLDVSIRRNAIDLYRNACHKKNVPYTEFQAWVNEVKSQKAISRLIATALEEADSNYQD